MVSAREVELVLAAGKDIMLVAERTSAFKTGLAASRSLFNAAIEPLETILPAAISHRAENALKEIIPETLEQLERHVLLGDRIGTLLHESTIERIVQNQVTAAAKWKPVQTTRETNLSSSILLKYAYHPDFKRPEVMCRVLSRDSEALSAYLKNHNPQALASDRVWAARMRRHAVLRANQLGSAFNLDLAAIDMPQLRFSIAKLNGDGIDAAAMQTGNNVYFLPNMLLSCGDYYDELGNIIVHEGTHYEQRYLVACRKFDQAGIGISATPTQMDKSLDDIAKARWGGVSESVALRFLEQRAGRQLLPKTAARAEMLEQSALNFHSHPLMQIPITQNRDYISRYQWHVHNNPEAISSIVIKLHNPQEGPALAMRLFGAGHGENIRQTILQDLPMKGLRTSSGNESARMLLSRKLTEAQDRLSDIASGKRSLYYNSLHEREARYNGAIAKMKASVRLGQKTSNDTVESTGSQNFNPLWQIIEGGGNDP